PQGLDPMGGARNWPGDAPAHDQQGDKNNQYNVGKATQEGFAPDAKTLCADVARVMNDGQAADEFIPAVERHGIDVNRCSAHAEEGARITLIVQRLQHDGWSVFDEWLQCGSYGDGMALWIIDAESGKVLAVSELLDCFLQGALGIAFQIALHIRRQAIAKDGCAAIQVSAHSPAQHQHLIVGGTQGYERDPDNQGDDKPGAEKSHPLDLETKCKKSPHPKTNGMLEIALRATT